MEKKTGKRKKTFEKKITGKTGKPIKKIPRDCLENALKIANDPDNVLWKDRSKACEKYIHQHSEPVWKLSNQRETLYSDYQLRCARDCLMRRDWHNLTEVILLYKPRKCNENLFPIFAKYASICLAYTNQPLLRSWLRSFGCNKSLGVVLKRWTQLSKSTDEASSSEGEET